MAPRLIVVSGPRGGGKETTTLALEKTFPHLRRIVTHTTRRPRHYECHGRHYHFVTCDEMDALAARGEFITRIRISDEQCSGLSKRELTLGVCGIADVAPPIARSARRYLKARGHDSYFIAILAPLALRRERILRRQPDLDGDAVDRLLAEDPVASDPSFFTDYNIIVHNDKEGDAQSALAAAITGVRRFLERE